MTTPHPPVAERAPARVGLLGNPGDVYEGRALGFSVWNFRARVEVSEAEALGLPAEAGLAALLGAAVGRLPEAPHTRLRLAAESDIPRQVGLAGSSALVVAALRALARWHGVALPPAELAERALAAEAEDLGIVAGPLDRVVQAHGGLLYMDFRAPRSAASYQAIDPALLPPLLVAWDPSPGQASGVPHADVRERFEAGDTQVRAVMRELPELADAGLHCLQRGDAAGFRQLVDRNFDLRASIWPLEPRHVEMVRVGRAAGAAVKFAGSGGAVVAVLPDAAARAKLERVYAEAGFRTFEPQVLP